MNIAVRFWLLTVIFFVMPAEAHAGWKNTTWGMSVTEAVAASGGTLTNVYKFDGTQLGAVGAEKINGIELDARLYFRSNRLFKVELKTSGEDVCDKIAFDYFKRLGRPADAYKTNALRYATWYDRVNDNHIGIITVGGSCTLSYRKLSE